MQIRLVLAASAALALSAPAVQAAQADEEDTPSNEELYEIIQAQQEELDRLVGKREDAGEGGRTTIGGYGELHYNSLDSGNELDFHRFILFVNHEFSDDVRFFSELELEHALAGEGKPGEIELEQAYVQFDVGDLSVVNAGLFLLPVGILNETHEPTTFYGVERNPIESSIIPTTWWEGGAMFSSRVGETGLSYDLALHSGLKTDANFSIRGGRQKVAEADAEDLAATARVRYTGIPGLELATTVQYQSDITQSSVAGSSSATLLETHAVYQEGPFTARALYARWDLDGAAPAALQRDVQDGYYVEGGYRFHPDWGVFARYNEWDNGGIGDTAIDQVDVGVNFWPHENVVLKFDIQSQSGAADDDGFNLGIGYRF